MRLRLPLIGSAAIVRSNRFTCRHECLLQFEFDGSELIYAEPPYLQSARKAPGRDRCRWDFEEKDHVRQKFSGAYGNADYAQAHCRISSCLQSMSLQGCSSLSAMQIALNGNAMEMFDQSKSNHIHQQFQQLAFPHLGRASSCEFFQSARRAGC